MKSTADVRRLRRVALVVVVMLLVTSFAASPRLSTSPGVPLVPSLPSHRIGVRTVSGVGEFYDTVTGQAFVPRGNNYIRLAYQSAPCNGLLFHSNFDPGLYDPAQSERALERMHQDGYNVVRVFMNSCRNGDGTDGLSSEYLINVVDFLRRAQANGVYVLITGDLPDVGVYDSLLRYQCCYLFDGDNLAYLTPGGLEAHRRYWQDFLHGLVGLGAPMEDVFAFSLYNEAFFDANLPPLSLSSGSVTTLNGLSYNMSRADDKQRMMDENLVFWIDSLRATILGIEPQALVTIGFFVPQGPNPAREGDPRVIRTYYPIANPEDGGSTADFIDLHPYLSPGGLTLPQYVENFEIGNTTRKPILMGEFGAFRSDYPVSEIVAQFLQDWQVTSCAYRFVGWLLWTWDSYEQPDLWNALSDHEVINSALSPENRPDPCVPGAFPGQDIAFGKPTVASLSLPSNPSWMAVDGSLDDWWGAGAGPPQWIEVDLQAPSTVASIRLVPSQYPAGPTVHDIWGRGPNVGDAYQLLHEFSGVTDDSQLLSYAPPAPWTNFRYIRVETMTSPSWVSWRELEVLRATAPTSPENLSAAAGDGRVVLTWDPSASDGGAAISGYRIYRGAASSGESLLEDLGNVTTFTDVGVTNGGTYVYRVSAVNIVGEGLGSLEVSAAPQLLVLAISGNRTSGVAPLAVSFTSAVSGGCPPYAYAWAFGDGSTEDVASPNHTYAAPGNYTVTLTVTDALGTVKGQGLQLSVTTAVPPPSPTPPGNEPAQSADVLAIYLLVGAAAVAAAGAGVAVFWRRRRNRQPPPP